MRVQYLFVCHIVYHFVSLYIESNARKSLLQLTGQYYSVASSDKNFQQQRSHNCCTIRVNVEVTTHDNKYF